MTDVPLPLIGVPDPIVVVAIDPTRSAGQMITVRAQACIDNGIHPLTKRPLHDQAPRDATREDRGRPFTCGGCAHREQNGWGFPKCDLTTESHCQSSDCRAWWPACRSFEPREEPFAQHPVTPLGPAL